jgi:LysR family hydrogen peroxide-inducible transcriptional activator
MNIRDLIYFSAVARFGHFAKAAAFCHVSQPTLSMQLKKLEEELGVQLIERGKREARLTAVGKVVLEKSDTLLRLAEEIRQTAKFAQDPYAGDVRVGIFPTLGPYLLPHIMPALRKAFPRLKIQLIEEKTDQLIRMMEEGEMDAACLALPVSRTRLHAIALFKEPFLLAVSKDHSLAKRSAVNMNDLHHEHILLLDEGHCLREQSLEACRRIGVGESDQFRATSLETLRHMVASGLGVTFMPMLASQQKISGIAYVPIQKPVLFREIGLLFKPASPRGVLFKDMAQAIRVAMDGKFLP